MVSGLKVKRIMQTIIKNNKIIMHYFVWFHYWNKNVFFHVIFYIQEYILQVLRLFFYFFFSDTLLHFYYYGLGFL